MKLKKIKDETVKSKYLTTQQAADAVGVHFQTMLRWIEAGKIEGIRKHGNCYMIDPDFKIKTKYSHAFLKRALPGKAA